MKKIILSLAVVFAMSSFTTVDTNVEEVNIEKITAEENEGRDCVDRAM